jgi:hypothetical protein
MGWDLVSKTDTGYRKYRDNNGNLRYQKPNGQFTNRNAWAGTHSQGATETASTETPPDSGTVVSGDIWKRVDLDTDNYKEAINYVINEPDSNYTPPLDVPSLIVGRGYPIADYPVNERVDMLESKTRDNQEYDLCNWAVTSLIIDKDGTITSSGERHTKQQSPENIPQLIADFKQIIDDLRQTQASYGEVVITETKLKVREYYQ